MSLRSKQIAVLAGLAAAGALWCVMAQEAESPRHPEEPAPSPSTSRTVIAQARATAVGARMNRDAPSEDESMDPRSAEVLRQRQAALAPMLEGAPDTPEQVDTRRGASAVYHHRINLRTLYPVAKALPG